MKTTVKTTVTTVTTAPTLTLTPNKAAAYIEVISNIALQPSKSVSELFINDYREPVYMTPEVRDFFSKLVDIIRSNIDTIGVEIYNNNGHIEYISGLPNELNDFMERNKIDPWLIGVLLGLATEDKKGGYLSLSIGTKSDEEIVHNPDIDYKVFTLISSKYNVAKAFLLAKIKEIDPIKPEDWFNRNKNYALYPQYDHDTLLLFTGQLGEEFYKKFVAEVEENKALWET